MTDPLSKFNLGPFAYLLETTADLRCAVKDNHHRYIYVNPSWMESFDINDATKVLGKTALDLFPEWRAARYIEEEKQVIEYGASYDYEEFLLNAHGITERWRTIKTPWFNEGVIQGLTNIGLRITPTEWLEQRSDEIPIIVKSLSDQACDNISISDIAKQLGLTCRTFQRQFHKIMRETPQQFRMRCKITRSKKQLRAGHKLASIALSCGFTDQSHFTNSFTKNVGMSPKKYQSQLHKKIK